MAYLYGKQHIERYQATGGEEGYHWRNGTTILLLHSKGRKTGKEHVHPLIYREFGNDYLVVASKGGAPQPPEWFRNLETNPDTVIQVKDKEIPVRARIATAQEKPAMWEHMTEVWPDYDDYQKKTARQIPVVVLEPHSVTS
jgi:deazaflavin-dependent oxidoreductase (nitroreductase family)